jgi:hypothetical protein
LRFFPLRRFPDNGQLPTPKDYQSLGYVAFSVFLTLSRLSSAHCLLALFHASPALGVSPSGLISARRVISPFELLSPLVVGSFPGHYFHCFVFFDKLPRIELISFQNSFFEVALRSSCPTSGFFPYVRPYLYSNNESRVKTTTLLGFLLLRVFPLPVSRYS